MKVCIHSIKDVDRISISTYIFALYLLLLPISTALSGIVGNTSLLNYITLLYIFFSTIEIVKRGYLLVGHKVWAIYAYMAYSLITCLWSKGLRFNYYFTTFVFSFIVLIFVSCRKYTKREEKLIYNAIVFSTLVVIFVTFININNTYAGRIVIQVSSKMDPNDFGCGTCVIIASLLVRYSDNKKNITIIGLVGVLLAVLLTGSRGALLMCLAEFLVWLVLYMRRSKWKTIFIIILLTGLLFLYAPMLSDELISRFSIVNVIENGGTGRVGIWKAAMSKFAHSNPLYMLFGYGHGSFQTAVDYHGGLRKYAYEAHNAFVNALIEGGLIGLSLLVTAFVQGIKNAKINKNNFGIIAILGFMATAISLDVQSYRIFPIPFLVTMLVNDSYYIFQEDSNGD